MLVSFDADDDGALSPQSPPSLLRTNSSNESLPPPNIDRVKQIKNQLMLLVNLDEKDE